MTTGNIIIGASIIAIGIAMHGYFVSKMESETLVQAQPRYSMISNHGTDLTARFLVLDQETGSFCMINCKGETTGWMDK